MGTADAGATEIHKVTNGMTQFLAHAFARYETAGTTPLRKSRSSGAFSNRSRRKTHVTIAAKQEVVMLLAIRRGIVVGLMVLAIACGHSTPTAPTANDQGTAVPPVTPLPPTNFPPLSGSSRTFAFDHELAYAVRDYTTQSRFVLYDSGSFALEFPSVGREYHGGYTEANGVMTFYWEDWSTAGPWGATGTIKDGSLTVQYNVIMLLIDFEHAAYLLTQ